MKASRLTVSGLLASAAIALVAAGLSTTGAEAKRADDTIRYSTFFATRSMDVYLDPNTNTETMAESVWDSLVTMNLKTKQIAPLLAKSWTQVNPTTIEFDLRDDVKWHDGQKFTAEDVVHTIGWLIDPATAMPNKSNYGWIDKIEKVNDYKVRLTTKAPTPYALVRLAYSTPIYPAHIHGKMADKTEYGRKPIGTGPYKAVSVDINTGFIVERNDDYKWGGEAKPLNNFKRFEARGLPEAPTHAARYLVGETDFVQSVGVEVYDNIKSQRPNDEGFSVRTGAWQAIFIPTYGAKLVPALGDIRVRRAIMMAIDRGATEKIRSGKDVAYKSICADMEAGCGFTKEPPKYDPAGAKKLLAEAGYPNGFDLEISTLSTSGTRIAAEAVAGFLNAVGIRATLDARIQPAMRQKINEKKVQIAVYADSAGTMPDVAANVLKWFVGGRFWEDPKVEELANVSAFGMDPEARKKATTELMDYTTEQAYIAPLNAQSRFYILSPEVSLDVGESTFHPEGWAFRQLNWKNPPNPPKK